MIIIWPIYVGSCQHFHSYGTGVPFMQCVFQGLLFCPRKIDNHLLCSNYFEFYRTFSCLRKSCSVKAITPVHISVLLVGANHCTLQSSVLTFKGLSPKRDIMLKFSMSSPSKYSSSGRRDNASALAIFFPDLCTIFFLFTFLLLPVGLW